MQSGIAASAALQTAFQSLLAEPDPPAKRGLLVTISSAPEELVPGDEVPGSRSSQSFKSDLANLGPLLKDDAAAYILLRKDGAGSSEEMGSCIAITYVPDKAPVRQKMLFASTRLTLVRELGTEHFSSTLFATTADELTAAGWAKHEAHGTLAAPLTQEEQDLVGIKEAEAKESMGTGTRRGHVGPLHSLPIDNAAVEALEQLKDGKIALTLLNIDISNETIKLVSTSADCSPAEISKHISSTSPQFTFYSHSHPASSTGQRTVLFIYTCPSQSKIKERMLYSATRNFVIQIAKNEAQLEIDKKMEASEADEINEIAVLAELEPTSAGANSSAPSGASSGGFARPKRPGRR